MDYGDLALSAARGLEWAHLKDGLVMEDDFDAEFRYDRPLIAIAGLDPDRVTFSAQ